MVAVKSAVGQLTHFKYLAGDNVPVSLTLVFVMANTSLKHLASGADLVANGAGCLLRSVSAVVLVRQVFEHLNAG